MLILDTSTLVVSAERQRREFNEQAIKELSISILNRGLMHPIVVREERGRWHLVAGERRLRAIVKLHRQQSIFQCDGLPIAPGKIPAILLSDLSPTAYREAELEENIIREDLTWQERAKAIAEIHELKLKRNPKQTKLDTARAISPNEEGVETARHELDRSNLVAAHLDDPEVQIARSLTDAEKLVRQKIKNEFLAELNKRAPKASRHTLYSDGAEAFFSRQRAGTFDLIIADPPYGMGAESFGDAAKLSHEYDDSSETAYMVSRAIFLEGYKVAKSNAHLFLFCDIDRFSLLKDMAEHYSWNVFRTPLIWAKGPSGHAPIGTQGFRRQYELILFASKGNKALSRLHSDIFDVPALKDKVHAAQKPIALYKRFMELCCIPGDTVLDPCCGSGTVFRAANELNLTATGIELDPKMATIAQGVLTELEL